MRCRYFLISLITLIAISCEHNIEISDPVVDAPVNQTVVPNVDGAIDGHIRVKMYNEITTLSEAESLFPDLHITSIRRTFPPCGKFEERTRAKGLHLWYDIAFDPKVTLTKAATDLYEMDGIQHIEFVKEVVPAQVTSSFNDPFLSRQWHYNNNGTENGYVAGSDINLFRAWEITTGSSDVIVAVVDGGVDWNHEDLAGNMWNNTAEYNGVEGVDDDNNGFIDDIHGFNFTLSENGDMNASIEPDDHGTHVAGIISAINNNGLHGCGIAGGDGTKQGARIMSCQILDGEADTGTAIKYAADNGAVICQNSWEYLDASLDPSVKEAIDYFIEFAGMDENGIQTGPLKGGLVLFAAANDNAQESYPAMYDKVMAVAAIGSDFEKAYYSNYGDWVDITAPGGSQNSSGSYDFIWSTLTNNDFSGFMGTSMACPHVSGVAALVVSQFGKEGFTNDMLWDILVSNTTNIDAYNPNYIGLLGSGLVDAYACLSQDGPNPPDPVGTIWTSAFFNAITLKWLIPNDVDSRKAFRFDMYYSTQSLEDLDPDNKPESVQVLSIRSGALQAGDTLTTTLSDLEFDQTYYFRVVSYDNYGHRSPLSEQVSQKPKNNSAPVITPRDGTSATLKALEGKSMTFDIFDPDGHTMTATLTPGSIADYITRNENAITLTIAAKKATAGTYTALLKVVDSYGGETILPITYTILPNTPPRVIAAPDNIYMKSQNESATLDMNDYFIDDDGETLSYKITSSSSLVLVNPSFSENILTLQGNWMGTATLTITAKDALNATCQTSFVVLIRDGQREFDLYPNPVQDVLSIRLGEEKHIGVSIYGTSGAKIFETDRTVTPFTPIQVNTSEWSAGSYTVVLSFDGKQVSGNVVKL